MSDDIRPQDWDWNIFTPGKPVLNSSEMLEKTPVNRILNVRLARHSAVMLALYQMTGWHQIEAARQELECAQMALDGRSRADFIKAKQAESQMLPSMSGGAGRSFMDKLLGRNKEG